MHPEISYYFQLTLAGVVDRDLYKGGRTWAQYSSFQLTLAGVVDRDVRAIVFQELYRLFQLTLAGVVDRDLQLDFLIVKLRVSFNSP